MPNGKLGDTKDHEPQLPTQIALRCEICDKPFTMPRCDFLDGQRACSRKCGYERRRRLATVTLQCRGCGQSFDRLKSRARRTKGDPFCSRKCMWKHQAKTRKPKERIVADRNERRWKRYHSDPEYAQRRRDTSTRNRWIRKLNDLVLRGIGFKHGPAAIQRLGAVEVGTTTPTSAASNQASASTAVDAKGD